jgi:hypothetical protein
MGSGGIAPLFLTSALDGGEWSASHPGRFTPCTHWTWGWVGPRAKALAPTRNWTLAIQHAAWNQLFLHRQICTESGWPLRSHFIMFTVLVNNDQTLHSCWLTRQKKKILWIKNIKPVFLHIMVIWDYDNILFGRCVPKFKRNLLPPSSSSTKLYSITFEKIIILTLTAVKTPNFTQFFPDIAHPLTAYLHA